MAMDVSAVPIIGKYLGFLILSWEMGHGIQAASERGGTDTRDIAPELN